MYRAACRLHVERRIKNKIESAAEGNLCRIGAPHGEKEVPWSSEESEWQRRVKVNATFPLFTMTPTRADRSVLELTPALVFYKYGWHSCLSCSLFFFLPHSFSLLSSFTVVHSHPPPLLYPLYTVATLLPHSHPQQLQLSHPSFQARSAHPLLSRLSITLSSLPRTHIYSPR